MNSEFFPHQPSVFFKQAIPLCCSVLDPLTHFLSSSRVVRVLEDDEITAGCGICSCMDISCSQWYETEVHATWQLHQRGAHLCSLPALCINPGHVTIRHDAPGHVSLPHTTGSYFLEVPFNFHNEMLPSFPPSFPPSELLLTQLTMFYVQTVLETLFFGSGKFYLVVLWIGHSYKVSFCLHVNVHGTFS